MKILICIWLIISHLQWLESHDNVFEACDLDNPLLEFYYSFRGYWFDMSSKQRGSARQHGDTAINLQQLYVKINQPGFITTPNIIISNGPWTIDFTIRVHTHEDKRYLLSNWIQQKWTFMTTIDKNGFLSFKVMNATMQGILVKATSNIALVAMQWTRIQIIWNPYERNLSMYFNNVEVARTLVKDDILVLTLPISNEWFILGVGDEFGKNTGVLNADLRDFYFYRSVKRCHEYETELFSFKKPVIQSSTYNDRNKHHAVFLANDGIKNQNDGGQCCSRTLKTINPFWSVDLQEDISIAYIDFYLRNDEPFQNLHQKYEIFLKTSKDKYWIFFARFINISGRSFIRVSPHDEKIGRYVKVMIVGVAELSLCEVEVYGVQYNDIDECGLTTSSPCSELVQCYNTIGSFHCGSCPDEYSGDGTICRDECSAMVCPHGSSCVNLDVGTECRCTTGTYMKNNTCVFNDRHTLRVSNFYLIRFFHPGYSSVTSKDFVELARAVETTLLQFFTKKGFSLDGIQVTNITKFKALVLNVEILIFTSQDLASDIKRTLKWGIGNNKLSSIRVDMNGEDKLLVEYTDACKFRPERCKNNGGCIPKPNFRFECKCGEGQVSGDGSTCYKDVVERGIIVASPIVGIIGILVICICVFRIRQKFCQPEPVGKSNKRNYDNRAYEQDDINNKKTIAYSPTPPPSLPPYEEEYEGNGNYDTFNSFEKFRHRVDDVRIQRHSVYEMRRVCRLEERQKRHSAYEMTRPRRK